MPNLVESITNESNSTIHPYTGFQCQGKLEYILNYQISGPQALHSTSTVVLLQWSPQPSFGLVQRSPQNYLSDMIRSLSRYIALVFDRGNEPLH